MAAPMKKGFDWQCKIVLIGDPSVGKTCIIRRYVDNAFSSSFISTIGIDFKIKTTAVGDHLIRVQIWDTAGQEKFRSITTAYYRGAKGIFLVYDVTNVKSFEHIPMWIKNVKRWAGEKTECVIVGNKCDDEVERQVERRQVENISQTHDMPFIETSAKNDINIEEAFQMMLQKIVEKNEDQITQQVAKQREKENVTLDCTEPEQTIKTKNCCK